VPAYVISRIFNNLLIMGQIADNLLSIKNSLPSGVTLVAVSKTKPESYIEEAYAVGQRIFGESKAQELVRKYEALPKDIEWHFIGHLQTNKTKYVVPIVKLIHSVDSAKLLLSIDHEAKKISKKIDCLLQFHVAQEETKWGFTIEEFVDFAKSEDFKSLQNVNIVGVMGMATNTDDEKQIHEEFAAIKKIFDKLKLEYFEGNDFAQISMGMSHDYKIAVEEGSTLVRVGSNIFGVRDYSVNA